MSILLPSSPPPPPEQYPIYARSGWRIPQEQVESLDERLIQIRAGELISWRRNLRLRSTSAYPYNCVGMIFAARRAWIEMDYIYDLLRADHYRQIQRNEIMIGDIVLYKDNMGVPQHVALVVTVDRSIGENIRVMSKWGRDAEFIHFVEDVLERLGTPAEYWTDRPYETR